MASRATLQIRDRDRGARALVNRAAAAAKPNTVKVGVFGERASAGHGNGVTVGDVATFHEFGTEHIPRRSFVADTIDANLPKLQATQRKVAAAYLAGKITKRDALALIGEQALGMMQKRMADGIPPPLMPATVARKGSSVPLIDTGQLRQSLAYEVEK